MARTWGSDGVAARRSAWRAGAAATPGGAAKLARAPGPVSHAGFVTRTFSSAAPLDGAQLRTALAALPPAVLRAKGFVHLAHAPDVVQLVQWVGGRWSIEPVEDAVALAVPPRESHLVVIGAAGQLAAADLADLARLFGYGTPA
jgi:G3E family GTPase